MFKLDDLYPEAKLEIVRRRAKKTRKEMAQTLQVSPSTVYNWEKGRTRPKITVEDNLYELTLTEQLYLHRKIAGLTQAQLAKDLNVSRYWVILMEQGKVDQKRLCQYWEIEWTS